MRKFITDNDGLRYYLKVAEDPEDWFHIEIRRKGDWVGYTEYKRHPINTEIVEVNIYIRNDFDPPRRESILLDYNNLPPMIMTSINLTQIKKHPKDYRHQGLGPKLLKLLIEHAKEKNVKRIFGSVMQDDIEKTPGLIEWYEKRGFKRCDPYQGCITNAAVWISMDLV